MSKPSVQRLREIFAHPESEIDLGRAALALARLEYPDLDEEFYVRKLDEAAELFRPSMKYYTIPTLMVDMFSEHLCKDLGFTGNNTDYYDTRNSFLNQVIERRTGIPITLSVIYLEVARRLGLPYVGIGLPGHFLVKYDDGRKRVYVDPFNGGQVVRRSDCQELLRESTGRRVVLREHDFKAVDKAYIIRRMLNNLRDIYLNGRRYRKGLEILDMFLVLSPDSREEIKQRAWLHYELGQYTDALAELEKYLTLDPGDEEEDDTKKWIVAIKRTQARLN